MVDRQDIELSSVPLVGDLIQMREANGKQLACFKVLARKHIVDINLTTGTQSALLNERSLVIVQVADVRDKPDHT